MPVYQAPVNCWHTAALDAYGQCGGALMPGSLLPRLGGVVAIVGGALNLASSQVHFGGPVRAAVPFSVVCLLIGVIGWHAHMWGREGAWDLCGLVLVAVGLVLGVVGMTSSALGVVGVRHGRTNDQHR